MVVARLIERKRDGGTLSAEEWGELIRAYTADGVPDYQMSALLMAVVWRGLASHELAALTDAMLHSGQRLQFDAATSPRVDKHSTGGVGDKTSLLLAPLVASCGVLVPMMSGRGLAHTGGTLDKLESIPGFRTDLSLDATFEQVRHIGCAMFGQTPEMAPADRKLYALRDVTATVESIPLIAASIMSKKLAEGLTGLVLDVKTGSGAFLPAPETALELARTMIRIGAAHGCPTVALLTAMDRPLGQACGNALEVAEAIAGLRGEGPSDLMEVTLALADEMLMLGGVADTLEEARRLLLRRLTSGRALEVLGDLIAAQGGDRRVVDNPKRLPQAPEIVPFRAPATGIVTRVEPRRIGHGIVELGGGRQRLGDAIDPAVGFVVPVKAGHRVEQGQPIAWIYARDAAGVAAGTRALTEAIAIGDHGTLAPLISHRVTPMGVETIAVRR